MNYVFLIQISFLEILVGANKKSLNWSDIILFVSSGIDLSNERSQDFNMN